MTRTTEANSELDAHPEVTVSQTIALENENGISNVDQWQKENLGPQSSEKNEEKLVTIVKKVGQMCSRNNNIFTYRFISIHFFFKIPYPIPITKHVPYHIEKIVPIPGM